MSTQLQIATPIDDVELQPLAEQTRTEMGDTVDQALVFRVRDAVTYQQAADQLVSIRGLKTTVKGLFRELIKSRHEAHKEATGAQAVFVDRLDVADNHLTLQMGAYLEDQRLADLKRKEAEAAAAATSTVQAETSALEKAEALEASGDHAGAAQALEQAVTARPKLPVLGPATAPTKADGVGALTSYSVRVDDLLELVKAIAAGRVSIAAVLPNEKYLNEQARTYKVAGPMPGHPGIAIVAGTDFRVAPGKLRSVDGDL